MLHPRDPHLDLLDDARHAQLVAERAQRRTLTDADDADATFAATVDASSEQRATVMLETTVGRTIRGVIHKVTADHLVVVDGRGSTWVRRDGITVLRPSVGDTMRAVAPHRERERGAQVAEILAELADERIELDIHLEGGAQLRGAAISVGRDVLTIRNLATGDHALVHLSRAVVIATARP